MKPAKKKAESILIIEAVGFSFILLASWSSALFDLPHYFFGDAPVFDWQRAVLRTIVIVPIWAWVHYSTKDLLKRLRYLEDFLLVCAWCRKVGHEGEWITTEEFFGSKFAKITSHGICPQCCAHVVEEMEKAERKKEEMEKAELENAGQGK